MTPEEQRALETTLLERLRVGPMHFWQLCHPHLLQGEIEMALYRMRKAGLLIYDRNRQLWRVR